MNFLSSAVNFFVFATIVEMHLNFQGIFNAPHAIFSTIIVLVFTPKAAVPVST